MQNNSKDFSWCEAFAIKFRNHLAIYQKHKNFVLIFCEFVFQDIWREVFGMWTEGFAPRAGDEGPDARIPSALLCMHCLLPAAPKGRSICDQGGTALLPS
jgi:hypothetical protein